ncbi:cytochrome c oxidase assembly protein [Nocardioides montaniterrae]
MSSAASLVHLAAARTGSIEPLPAFSWGTLFSQWSLAPLPTILTVWALGLYAVGVVVMRRRGDRWPVGRSIAWVVGWTAFYLITSSGFATYDTTLLSVHMAQHMVLSMVVPLSLALAAPVTLALRTLPSAPRRWVLWIVHSRLMKVLSFPPLAFLLYVISPWALYFSGWYPASLHHPYIHEMMHVHLVVVGSLFFWPLVGVDPIPGRVDHPFRVLLAVMTLPFHAFLGITIMNQQKLLGGSWYPDLHRIDPWLPSAASDQHLAGGLLWGSGDVVGLVLFVVLFVQWVQSSMKEAKREDRRLDRLDRLHAQEQARLAMNARLQQQAGQGPNE